MTIDVAAMRESYANAEAAVVRANFVSSLDGAATVGGRSGGLGDADDQRLMGVLRSLADVVVVGAGTIRTEHYGPLRLGDEDAGWRTDAGLAPHPSLAIVSASLDLDPSAPLFRDAPVRPIVATCEGSDPARRAALAEVADVVVAGAARAVDPARLVGELADRGRHAVLVEGGPHLFGDFLEAGAVDELCLTLGPVVVGGEAGRIARGLPEAARPARLVHAIPHGDLVFLRYRLA